MDRMDFLKTCGFACITGTAFATFGQGCGSANYYALATIVDNQIAVKKSEFIDLSDGRGTQRKYVLVKIKSIGFPICIYRQSEAKFDALFIQCTHRGCELQPNDHYLVCPCHGSEFSNAGEVVRGPAETNLKQFKVTADNDTIYIHL